MVVKVSEIEKEEIKIGVCGSRLYEKKKEIKEVIFKLKQTFGDALIIVSGGRQSGADTYVKKFALEFDCKYEEFNPAHTKHNLYSVLSIKFYGRGYAARNFFARNVIMIEYVDYMIVFVEEEKLDSDILHVISRTEKTGKRIVIKR